MACGRTPRASNVAAPFGHPPCGDANAIQLEEDPHVAFAHLTGQRVKSIVERVVTKAVVVASLRSTWREVLTRGACAPGLQKSMIKIDDCARVTDIKS